MKNIEEVRARLEQELEDVTAAFKSFKYGDDIPNIRTIHFEPKT
jgi:hypothetical protein